jgi:hypothetical protein
MAFTENLMTSFFKAQFDGGGGVNPSIIAVPPRADKKLNDIPVLSFFLLKK